MGTPRSPVADPNATGSKPLPADVEKYINDNIPRSIDENGSHALSKHGNDAQTIQDNVGKLKDGKGPYSNWSSDQQAQDVAKNLPENLKETLRNDPAKLQAFKDYMNDTSGKARFGFQTETGQPQGDAYAVRNGQLMKQDGASRVYTELNKTQVKGSGGQFTQPNVKTSYPVYQEGAGTPVDRPGHDACQYRNPGHHARGSRGGA